MDTGSWEPESQPMERQHSPQPHSYFEDEDVLPADDSVDDDVVMRDTEQDNPNDIVSMHERSPPSGQIPVVQEETQTDSFRSVIEETQLIPIELETQLETQPLESDQHEDLSPTPSPSPKEVQQKNLPVADDGLAKFGIPPPIKLTREPLPETPGYVFPKAPCRGPSASIPNDTSRQIAPPVQQRRNIPIDNSHSNVLKKPLPLGQPPPVPVFNNHVAQPIQSNPSVTDPKVADNRKAESVQKPAAPIAQRQQGLQVLKSRPKSFKNRLRGPSQNSKPPPFPDVDKDHGNLNERPAEVSRGDNPLPVPATVENIQRVQLDSIHVGKQNNVQQNTHRSHNVGPRELDGQSDQNNCSTEHIAGELGPEGRSSRVASPPTSNSKEQSRHALEDISNLGTRNIHSNARSSRHDQRGTRIPKSAPQTITSRSRSVTPSSRPRSRMSQSRAVSSHAVNRPLTGQALVSEGVPKQRHTNGSKVSKTYAGQPRDKLVLLSSITPDILEKMKVYETSVGSLGHLSAELEKRRGIIEVQHNDNIKLKESLQNVESELQSACEVKNALEVEQERLSLEVEKLKGASEQYKEHVNDVIRCQKALKAESDGRQEELNILHQKESTILTAQAALQAELEAKTTQFNGLLAEIKKIRGERDKELSEIRSKIGDLTEKNKDLNSTISIKDSELKQGHEYIEKLEKQLNDEQLNRHRELMDILQQPQVNHIEALCEEGGMLHKILNTGTSTKEILEEISTAVNDSLKRESEWPGTLREILKETSSALHEKLQNSCDKDSAFHESSLKLFDDIKERLPQIGVDKEKNAQLSDRLVELQEMNATLKANLESKNIDSEATITRLKELTEELVDLRAQLANKNDQLMSALAQPRDDPDARRKIADLTTEISRLKDLLATANNDKHQSKQDLQTSQDLITRMQKQLRETETKLQTAETDLRQVQSTGRKFQIDCKNAVEKARQEIITITAGEKRDMAIQHTVIVEDLKKKRIETGDQLKIVLEELESSKELNTHQTTIISQLKSDIANFKYQLQERLEDIQVLDQRVIPREEIVRQTQELSMFRQIFAEHQSVVQDLRSELPSDMDLIRKEFQAKMKEAYGTKQELERLEKENDQLRRKVADSEKLEQHHGQQARSQTPTNSKPAKYSLKPKAFIAPPPPSSVGERHTKSPPVIHKQASRKPAARQNSHMQKQYSVEDYAAQNIRQRSKSNNFGANVTSTPSRRGGSPHGSQTSGQIKPFSSLSSSSPLTDLESIMGKLDSVSSHAELQQLYQSKSHKLDIHEYGETPANSQHASRGITNLEDNDSARDDERKAASGSDEEFVTFPRKMKGPSHAEESQQRRTARPLRSALKKTTFAGGADVPQEQTNTPSSQKLVSIGRKPPLQSTRKTNAGLSSMFRSGSSTYNRIASGNVKGTQDSHAEKQVKSDGVLVWEPAPSVGRFKRQRSTSALAVVARPAKAPRISLGPRTSRSVIPDSQDQM